MQSCTANNIDEHNYVTKHTPECTGDCSFRGPDPEKVKGILRQGLLPVVRITTRLGTDAIEVEVTSVAEGSMLHPFIAISHVWSDGLGNQGQNELPICQLRRLQRFADYAFNTDPVSCPSAPLQLAVTRQIPYNGWAHKFHGVKPMAYAYKKAVGYRQTCFWVDTLCVPRDPETRSLAISRLRDVYWSASSVLVLDADLEELSSSTPKPELLVRMQASGWMRRMWTLQEGALGAWSLQIQLSDGTFDVGGSAARLWSGWWSRSLVTNTVELRAANFFDDFAHLRKAFDKPLKTSDFDVPGYPTLWESNPKQISRLPETSRTERLLQEISLIPPSIIFSPGRKLQRQGYRWVTNPLWITQLYHRNIRGSNAHTPFDPSVGLQVWFPGFIIFAAWVIDPVAPHFYFCDTTSRRWYKATYDVSTGDVPNLASDLKSRGHTPLQTEMAVIVPPMQMSSDVEILQNFDAPWKVPVLPNVKLTLNPYKGGKYFSKHTIYCNYLRRVRVQLVAEDEVKKMLVSNGQQLSDDAEPGFDTLASFPQIARAERTWEGDKSERPYTMERDQKWCIS
ncbi:putative Heterokaryon incompatibility domain-containing protein [Seiridium cardinale]